jgi:uncharacterized RDD family membrane protein YckC
MLYEAMLLFGIVFIAAWLFSTLAQQRNALYLHHILSAWLTLVVGTYFVWCWSRGGQTLAMKTWRIRLVSTTGAPISRWRAAARYALAWLWFLPGLLLAWVFEVKAWMLVLIPLCNMICWALTVYLDPERQFLHDRLAGTRLIIVSKVSKKQKSGARQPDNS